MEAPDKICVNFPFGEKYPWRGLMVTKQGLNRHDTVYISQNSLLSKLTERMEQAKVEAGGCSNMHASGKYIAYQEMIDLINEL